MRPYGRLSAILLVLGLTACTGHGTTPTVPTTPYHVTLDMSGTLPLQADLGTAKLPEGTVGLANLGILLAEPLLAEKLQAKNCTFVPKSQASAAGAVTVGVTATCAVRGAPIVETLTFTFTPVVA